MSANLDDQYKLADKVGLNAIKANWLPCQELWYTHCHHITNNYTMKEFSHDHQPSEQEETYRYAYLLLALADWMERFQIDTDRLPEMKQKITSLVKENGVFYSKTNRYQFGRIVYEPSGAVSAMDDYRTLHLVCEPFYNSLQKEDTPETDKEKKPVTEKDVYKTLKNDLPALRYRQLGLALGIKSYSYGMRHAKELQRIENLIAATEKMLQDTNWKPSEQELEDIKDAFLPGIKSLYKRDTAKTWCAIAHEAHPLLTDEGIEKLADAVRNIVKNKQATLDLDKFSETILTPCEIKSFDISQQKKQWEETCRAYDESMPYQCWHIGLVLFQYNAAYAVKEPLARKTLVQAGIIKESYTPDPDLLEKVRNCIIKLKQKGQANG